MSEDQPDTICEPQAAYDAYEPRTTPCVERLVSSGRLKPATVDLLELGRPLDMPHDLSISEALSQQRSES